MLKFLKSIFSGFQPPELAGPSRKLGMLGPGDGLISDQAQWLEDEVQVTAHEAGSVPLFEFQVDGEEQCRLTCCFRMSSKDLAKGAYPEMWCRVTGRGEFFSKGLNYKLRGTIDWTSCELPFYLMRGQRAELLRLNIVFSGAGMVCLRDIELHSTPLKEN